MSPDHQTATASDVRFAREFVGYLSVVWAELTHESGPLGFEAVELRTECREHGDRLETLWSDLGATSAPLRDLFDRFDSDVIRGLRKLDGDPVTRRSVVGGAAAACRVLLGDVCAAFPIDPPVKRREAAGMDQQAIVATDVKHYTKMAARRNIKAMAGGVREQARVANELDDLIAGQVRRAVGTPDWEERVVLSAGDGFTLRFPTMTAAVRFARALHQEARAASGRPPAEEGFVHRVGIAWGNVNLQIRAGSARRVVMSGIPFIEAARMEACCDPGGIAVHDRAWSRWLEEPPDPQHGSPEEALRPHFADHSTDPKSRPLVKDEHYPAWLLPAGVV